MLAAFAAKAALLDAAEGRGRIRHQPAIKADHAGFDSRRHTHAAPNIARVDVGGKAVFRVVGVGDGFRLGLETGDGSDRPENFLMRHLCVGRNL